MGQLGNNDRQLKYLLSKSIYPMFVYKYLQKELDVIMGSVTRFITAVH